MLFAPQLNVNGAHGLAMWRFMAGTLINKVHAIPVVKYFNMPLDLCQ